MAKSKFQNWLFKGVISTAITAVLNLAVEKGIFNVAVHNRIADVCEELGYSINYKTENTK